jgi:hypothetical protein
MTMETRGMGWSIEGNSFMEKSGRQIAEDMFKAHDVVCTITELGTDGTDGGSWCFWVIVEIDAANAVKWDAAFE